MKGDFSRLSFDPTRQYTRVLMQQGRVQTDADWNEQATIADSRHVAAVSDIIGRNGGPEHGAGFAVDGFGGARFNGVSTSVGIRPSRPCRVGVDLTLEGWIKVPSHGARGVILTGLRLGAGEDEEAFRLEVTERGRLGFWRTSAGGAEDGADDDVAEAEVAARGWRHTTSSDPLPTGRFVHVAAVSDRGHTLLYIDGAPLARAARSAAAPGEITAFVVGCHHRDGEAVGFFSGQIDRLRLWDAALGEDVVAELANVGRTRHARHLVHDWRFGGVETVVEDVHGRSEIVYGDGHLPPAPAEPEIWIGGGRYYIDGSMCLQEGRRAFPGVGETAVPKGAESLVAFLESWDRVRLAAQDPGLLDPALGGVDTAARLETVCRVRFAAGESVPDRVDGARRGTLAMSGTPDATVNNRLIRVEIHHPGYAAGQAAPPAGGRAEGLSFTIDGEALRLTEPSDDVWSAGRAVELVRPGVDAAATARVLSAARDPDDGLWRLELAWSQVAPTLDPPDHWRLRPIATFKWSPDNGAWVFPVTRISVDATGATAASIESVADRGDLLASGGWAEVFDEAAEAARLPGVMCGIAGVEDLPDDPAAAPTGMDTVTLALSSSAAVPMDASAIRLWAALAFGDAAVGDHPVQVHKPLVLQGGVRLSFGAGHFDCGDYWLCPIRGGLEWPRDARGRSAFLPPQGPTVRTAALATVRFDGGATRVHDLRRHFATLVDATERVDAALSAAAPEAGGLREMIDAAVAEATDRFGHSVREQISEETRRTMDGLPNWPPEHCILTFRKLSHPGWRHEDMQLSLPVDDPRWSPLEMPRAMGWPVAAAALPGVVFCLAADGALHRLDLEQRRWERLRGVAEDEPRFARLVALDGRLHALGSNREGSASIHAVYDTDADTWSRAAPIPGGRDQCGVAAWNGRLYAVGGRKPNDRRPLALVETYDPQRDDWQAFEPLPEPVSDCAAIGAPGQLVVVGGHSTMALGRGDRETDKIRTYAPENGGWREGQPLAHARRGAGLAVTGKRLHVVGGVGHDGRTRPNEMFDLAFGMRMTAPQSLQLGEGGVIAADNGVLYRFSHIRGQNEGLGEFCVFERALYVHSRVT